MCNGPLQSVAGNGGENHHHSFFTVHAADYESLVKTNQSTAHYGPQIAGAALVSCLCNPAASDSLATLQYIYAANNQCSALVVSEGYGTLVGRSPCECGSLKTCTVTTSFLGCFLACYRGYPNPSTNVRLGTVRNQYRLVHAPLTANWLFSFVENGTMVGW
jgi:hypothetical protein